MTTPLQMQSQALDYMKHGQQATLQMASTISDTWFGAARGAGGSSAHGDVLPGPAEFVDQVFDFWVQLLEAQRAFAHSWVSAVAMGGFTSGPLVDMSAWNAPATSAIASSAPAGTAGSTADEHVSAAASDAVARAAGVTAKKTRP